MANRASSMIIYEQPLSEKIRLFLRLEALVQRLRHHMTSATQEDIVAGVIILLDLYNLSSRMDLRSEVIKELDRTAHSAKNCENCLKKEKQEETLDQLAEYSKQLHAITCKLDQHLRDHMFFNGLRQRASLPGGINGVDIPILEYWSSRPKEQCLEDLAQWSHNYQVAVDAVSFTLGLIRNCCEMQEVTAKAGFYQSSLNPQMGYQLLQVMIDEGNNYYPEISASQQRFSLRFIDSQDLAGRVRNQLRDDVTFYLKLCKF